MVAFSICVVFRFLLFSMAVLDRVTTTTREEFAWGRHQFVVRSNSFDLEARPAQ